MIVKKIVSFIFITIIASFCSYAQVYAGKKTADKENFSNKTYVSAANGLQKNSSSKKINSDTLYSSIIKQDFIVNNFKGEYGANQLNAASAIDDEGNYAVIWQDYRNVSPDIYVQFFNSNDEKIGPNIKVNNLDMVDSYPPSIAANGKGDFVIAWNRNYNAIGIKKFNISGNRIHAVFETSVSANIYSQPSVAVSDNGSYLISWTANNVMAELFDKTGNPVSPEIFINISDSYSSNIKPGQSAAADSTGNFYILWNSYGNSVSNYYLQIIDSSGEKVKNISVSDTNDTSYKNYAQLASTNDGHVLIAWWYSIINDYGSTKSMEKVVIYRPDGKLITKDLNTGSSSDKIVTDKDSTFYISYFEYDNQQVQQQYIQKIKTDGTLAGNRKQVKFNTTKDFLLTGADLTNIVNKHFYIVPELKERDDANIYIQKFNTGVEAAGDFIKVNDDSESAYQQNPAVKFNNKGESIVLWQDKRNGRNDLYGQVYDKDFNPVGNNIMINETDADHWYLMDKKVQCLSDGTFVVAYSSYEDFNKKDSKVYLRLIKEENAGKNILVKNDELYVLGLNIALNVNSRDEILVSWYTNYSAYIRKFDKDFTPLTSKIQLSIPQNQSRGNLAVSIDSLFNVLTVWDQYNVNSSSSNISGIFFDETGKEQTEPFFISNISGSIQDLRCINEQLNYAVAYSDYSKIHIMRRYYLDKEYFLSGDWTIQDYAYGYSLNLIIFKNQKLLFTYNSPLEVRAVFMNDNKRESEFCNLHTYTFTSSYNNYSEYLGTNGADFYDNKIFFTYENMNSGSGYDIQANVQEIDSIDFTKEPFITIPVKDALNYNYPNPFNSITRITYTIAAYHKVKLTVYDILGREVRILVDKDQEKGNYEIDFNASGLASGVYFYRLEAFDTIVRKMVLLK